MTSDSSSKLWVRNYTIFTVTNLLFFLSFQMLIPVLPLYIQDLGGSDFIVGIIVGAGTLGGLFARPVAGKISDRYAKLPVYFLGLVLCTLMIFSYSYCKVLILLLILRLLHGFSMGLTTTSNNTMVADVLPKARFTEGMGYFGMGSVLSMAFAPVIALYLAQHFGFTSAFHVSFILILITIVISLFIKKSAMPVIVKKEVTAADNKKESMYEKKAIPAAVLLAIQSCGYCAVATFIALYGKEMGIESIGIFFTVYSIFVILCRLVAGNLADRKGYNIVIIPALILSAIGFIFLGAAHSLTMLLIGAAFIGIGFGSAFPTFQAMAIRDVEPNRRGAATATVMSGFDLGFGIGAIAWGLVSGILGYSIIYYLNAGLLIISLFVYLYLLRKKS